MTAVYAVQYKAILIGLLLVFGFLPPVHAVVQIDGNVPSVINSGDGEVDQPARYIIGVGKNISVNRSTESIQIGLSNSFIDLTIQNAALYRTGAVYVGYGVVSANSATVTGAGTRWESNSGFYVGYGGSGGSLRIANEGRVTFGGEAGNAFVVGHNASSDNNAVVVTGSGSTLSGEAGLQIGVLGRSNSLRIENSGLVECTVFGVGTNSSGNDNSLVITGSGSSLMGSGSQNSYVGGKGGENALRVEAGGKLALTGNLIVGEGMSSVNSDRNSVLITGEGSSMESSSELVIGSYGSDNLLSISDQGKVLTVSSRIGIFGNQNQMTITGYNSVWNNSGSMVIGEEGSENAVTVADGALVMLGGSLSFSQGSGSKNHLRLDSGFFAWAGNQTEGVMSFLEEEVIQVWNGVAWESAIAGNTFNFFYFISDEEAFALTGYHDLGGYTILTSLPADAVPEPSSWALMMGVMLTGALLRKNLLEASNRKINIRSSWKISNGQ